MQISTSSGTGKPSSFGCNVRLRNSRTRRPGCSIRSGSLTVNGVVELGCGPQGCIDALSERVGSRGSVVGVDRSAEAVELVRKLVADRGLDNVELVHGDARSTGLTRGSFDLATARLVLVNVPRPEQIVAEAAELVRPGGAVAFHEADWIAHVCDPPLEAWTRLIEVFRLYAEINGIDLFVGRRLPRLLRDAGLVDVYSRPVVHVYEPGHGRRFILSDFVENLSERLVEQELIARDELDDLQTSLGAQAPLIAQHSRRISDSR